MFFRREKPHQTSFEERLTKLKEFKFSATREAGSTARVTRDGYGAILEEVADGKVKIGKSGLVVGNEIAVLTNGGYQMFFRTPSGKELPAQADQLKTLHAFDEDLREGVGLTSLYNLSLGTTSEAHMYDRVEDRDRH